MITRSSRFGKRFAEPHRGAPQVHGAHASRVAMVATGCTPGGVEALGRFRRHSGSGARRQRELEVAGCRRGRVRSLDGRRSCPQPVGNGRCCVRVGSLGTAGFGPSSSGGCGLGRFCLPPRRTGQFASLPWWRAGIRPQFFREVVGLGTSAAAPAMAHAILEACGCATAVWCFYPPPRWF
jgi:hypothetical protein